MALPSQGLLSTDIIASEVGASTGTTHKLAGGTSPTTDSLTYWYRSGNVGTSGVGQTAPFNFSDFFGQEALYKCVAYAAGGSGGTATIIQYPGISVNISVPANVTQYYCTRINYDGSVAASSVSGLTVTAGSQCNANVAVGNSAASAFVDYGTFGVKLYSSYNIDGSGTSTNYLCNDAGGTYTGTYFTNPNNNSTDGRLNQVGLWSGSQNYVGTGSLSFGIYAPTTKDYFIGVGCDNYAEVYLDGILKVGQTANRGSTDNFKYWHIYPINITAGVHLLRVQGVNNAGGVSNPGSVGIEVYNNTAGELATVIGNSPNGSSTPSGLNVLYSSKDYRGAGVIGAAFNNQSVQCPETTTTTTTTTTSTTTTTTTAATFVTIDTFTPSTMGCFNFYDYAAESDVVVDTNVDVEIIWNGDLGGSVTGTVTISSGTSCGTVGVASGGNINCNGEFLSGSSVNLDPSAFGSQIYQVGTNSTGPYPC